MQRPHGAQASVNIFVHLNRCEHDQALYKVCIRLLLIWSYASITVGPCAAQRASWPALVWFPIAYATPSQETFTAPSTGANLGNAACKYDKQC